MRWLVGDIHGCVKQFDALLRKIDFDPLQDELWCVGDLVNTGPESSAVLRLWRDVGGRSVLGNHDIHAIRVHAGVRERRPHDTLDELLAVDDAEQLFDRLKAQPILQKLSGEDGAADVWLVHAGLHPDWSDVDAVAARLTGPHDALSLRGPWIDFATRVRCCTAEGEMNRRTGPPEDCRTPFRPWDAFYRGATLVVHGHWARRGFYRAGRSMSLDSGCVYGGALTAWCQDEDRLVQVPFD